MELALLYADLGIVLKELEMSPVSMKAVLEVPKGKYTVDMSGTGVNPPDLYGAVMKDGTVYYGLFGMGGSSLTEESDRYVLSYALERILDVEQVDSLLFTKEIIPGESTSAQNESEDELPLEDRFYVVPLES